MTYIYSGVPLARICCLEDLSKSALVGLDSAAEMRMWQTQVSNSHIDNS